NKLPGRVALIFSGGACDAYTKIHAAEVAGAAAVLLADDSTAPYLVEFLVGIPAFRISVANGDAIRNALRTGATVRVTLTVTPSLVRDGTIDNQIAAHEWGHHLSNRLIGNANGLTNDQGRGMGEGWSDFVALLMTVKPEDAAAPANSNWAGTFAAAGYVKHSSVAATNAYYFGTRRYPYTTD